MDVRTLEEFRRWACSDGFPERGRIDYIAGRIEVDMSPEDLYRHGTLKTEIVGVLYNRVKRTKIGDLFVDCTRISSIEGDVSAEPDVVFVSHESIDAGRVKLVPKASGEPGRYIEIEGAPDLIVELVSDSSVAKDTTRLPEAYFKAGVPEFWLADARGEDLVFRIHRRGPSGFEPAETDDDGFQRSAVLGCRYRLERHVQPSGRAEYDLLEENN